MLIVSMFLLQNIDTKLEPEDTDTWMKLEAGSVDSVLYRIDFPVSSSPPTIKSITVNQNVICRGTRPPSKHQAIPTMLNTYSAGLSVGLIESGPAIKIAH
jgi:hypothetical protein